MKGKEIIKFLLLRDAFTSRNITTLGLVLIFFFIYSLSHGGLQWIPRSPNLSSTSSGRFQPLNTTAMPIPDSNGVSAPSSSSVSQNPSASALPDITSGRNGGDAVPPQGGSASAQADSRLDAPTAARTADVDSNDEAPAQSERLRILRERLQNMKTKQQGDAAK